VDRVTAFVTASDDEAEEQTLTSRLAAGAERSLANTSSWERFCTAVTIAGFRRTAGEAAVLSALGALSVGLLLTSVSGSMALGIVGIAAVALAEWVWIRRRMRTERRRFAAQLADHLSVVGGSLRVGHGLAGALAAALEEADEPTAREFGRAVRDERLGMPLEDALQALAVRMENREVEHVALLAKLQREAGADAAEMIDQVVATVREREELRRTVRTLTAQGRLSQTILTLLPVGSLLFLTIANPEYVDPLYSTAGGHLVLAVAATLLLLGALIIRKIVSFRI
jgi:tight adherence protein B